VAQVGYYAGGGSVGQLDYLFLSPALAAATAGTLPHIERRGIGMREASAVDGLPLPKQVRLEVSDTQPPTSTVSFRFDRFPGVTAKSKASDHCPVFSTCPSATGRTLRHRSQHWMGHAMQWPWTLVGVQAGQPAT